MTDVKAEDGGAASLPRSDEGSGEVDRESEAPARLREELRAAVHRICPPWLADRADDLVQVAVMRVLDIRRRREGTTEFSPFYLKKAAYCALVDEIRRQRRRREVSLEEEAETLPPPPAEEADPEKTAMGREAGRAIQQCLGEMVRPRRQAVTLYLQGHGTVQVGKLLGWEPKKAENLIYRGLADLRVCLTRKGIRR